VAFIPVGFSVFYFSEKNLLSGFIAFSFSMLIYTLLVFKDLKFLSSVSFLTVFPMSLLMLGITGKQTDGVFSNAPDERAFMLSMPLLLLFVLINSAFLAKTKHGFIKLISLVCIALSVFMLVAFGTNSPAFYQNFVYTRINILILFIFNIYLIIKRKKLVGILGIFLSIGILLLSASMFSDKVYTLEEKEQKEVIAYIDPIGKEMFGYYNKKDYANFCKYCGFFLKNLINKDPVTIKSKREESGPYTYFGEPSKVIRKSGRFYVEYPVKFQNVKDLMYLTFVIENITSNPPILYGYSLSAKQGLHTNSGNENERDR
jgi:hypothetical protein